MVKFKMFISWKNKIDGVILTLFCKSLVNFCIIVKKVWRIKKSLPLTYSSYCKSKLQLEYTALHSLENKIGGAIVHLLLKIC